MKEDIVTAYGIQTTVRLKKKSNFCHILMMLQDTLLVMGSLNLQQQIMLWQFSKLQLSNMEFQSRL